MLTDFLRRHTICLLALVALLCMGVSAAHAQSAASVTSSTYYNLVSRMGRCLKMPETTPEERTLKVQNLTSTYTFKDRLPSTTGVGKSARFIWNTLNGHEAAGGYPVQRGGGSAGTVPRKGYRPHLLDLYANWKAASLSTDPAVQTYYYKEVLAALPPINAKDRLPYIYKSPFIYVFVADASWHLGDRVEPTFLLWQQFDEDAVRNARLSANDPNLEKKKNDYLLKQLKGDLKVDPQNAECNSLITDGIANAMAADAMKVKAQLAASVLASIAFTGTALNQQDLAQPPIVTGTYATPAATAMVRLPLTLWAENAAGQTIGDRRDVQPGEAFTLILNNIGADNGVARIGWALRDEKLAALLGIPAQNRAPGDFPFVGAVQAEERFRVRFHAKGGQPDAWAAASGARDARNREAIGIRYDWNSSTMKSPFAWRVYRVEGGKRIEPPAVAQTENTPAGLLTIPANTLVRGSYLLTVQQDSRKADPADFADAFSFRITSPAVALVIGVADYYSASLNHPCDDAGSIVERLKTANYADDDLIWVYGTHDRNSNSGVLIAHGLGKALAGLDSMDGKTIKPIAGQPDTVIVTDAYVTPDVMELAKRTFANLIIDRKPIHAMFFYAGHGTSEEEKGSIADVLVSARPPEVPGWEKDLYLNQFTELKGLLAPQAQPGMAMPPVFVSIMDACRPSVAGVEVKGLGSRLVAGVENNVLLLPVYSAALGEISFETGAKGDEILYNGNTVPHGLFTFALLQGFDKSAGSYTVKNVLPPAIDVMKDLMSKVNDFNARTRGPSAMFTTQTITIGKVKMDGSQVVNSLGGLVLQVPLIY